MQKLIKELAEIQTGVFERPDPEGTVFYIQTRHVDSNGRISSQHPVYIAGERLSRYLLAEGDVLFAAKGTRNYAAAYTPILGPAVASSNFFTIRIKSNHQGHVLPEYLAWAINHGSKQEYIKASATGTSIPSVSRGAIAELAINIPSLEVQHCILKIHELREREKELKRRIAEKQEQYLQHILLQATKKSK